MGKIRFYLETKNVRLGDPGDLVMVIFEISDVVVVSMIMIAMRPESSGDIALETLLNTQSTVVATTFAICNKYSDTQKHEKLKYHPAFSPTWLSSIDYRFICMPYVDLQVSCQRFFSSFFCPYSVVIQCSHCIGILSFSSRLFHRGRRRNSISIWMLLD